MTDYYPFGEIRIDQSFTIATAANGTTSGTPTSTGYKNPYKFTGKELDTDIGLYYYGARYYNPAIGRFVSMDPWEGDLKDPQTLNKYSYVRNNPLRYTDPSGKSLYDPFVDAYNAVKNTISDVINVVPNTVDYVKEFSTATYYGTKAFYSAITDDDEGLTENLNEFAYHTDKMTDSAQKSLNGIVTIGAVGLGAAESMATKELQMMQPSTKIKFQHGKLTGKNVKDVINDLKNKKMNSNDVPIGYVKINEKNIVVNNKSFSAIKFSGVKPSVKDFTSKKWAQDLAKSLLKQSKGKVFDKLKFK